MRRLIRMGRRGVLNRSRQIAGLLCQFSDCWLDSDENIRT